MKASISFSLSLLLLLVSGCQGTQKGESSKKTKTHSPSGKHLFILSGQSNMVGMDEKKSFSPLIEKALGKDNIIVVKDATGGQSIRSWVHVNHEFPPPTVGRIPKVRGELYKKLMTKVTSSIKEEEIATTTFIWMQGESDLRNSAYHIYLRELLKQLEKDLGTKNINVVIGRISDNGLNSPKRLEGRKYIRKTQVDFAESLLRGSWVNTDDLNDIMVNGKLTHDLHYSKEGYHLLGKRFAQKAIQLLKKHDRVEAVTPSF